MRRNFLKSAAAAGIGLAGASAFAQQQAAAPAAAAAGTGLRGNASDVYVMNVMVSGVEYWFPVYEMFKQAASSSAARPLYRHAGI
jgi:ribose transport system substrate-binding protein